MGGWGCYTQFCWRTLSTQHFFLSRTSQGRVRKQRGNLSLSTLVLREEVAAEHCSPAGRDGTLQRGGGAGTDTGCSPDLTESLGPSPRTGGTSCTTKGLLNTSQSMGYRGQHCLGWWRLTAGGSKLLGTEFPSDTQKPLHSVLPLVVPCWAELSHQYAS